MLSRTAENLYWTARYLERAEGVARLFEMGQRMSMIPGAGRDEWRSVLAAAAAADAVEDTGRVNETHAVGVLLLAPDRPSSIRWCLERARDNARAVRTAVTREMWEALNDGWRRLESVDAATALRELPVLIDWVKGRASMFRGAAETSMLRDDGYAFLRLGSLVERADLTLRLLEVKYAVLLPESDVVGGGRDHHQWTSILHATSSALSYHHVYRGDFSPWLIADFLILNRRFPRSLAYSYAEVARYLTALGDYYGESRDCRETAADMARDLRERSIEEIFQTGLHEFAQAALARNNDLSRQIARDYNF